MQYCVVKLDNIDSIEECYVLADSEESARDLAVEYYGVSPEQVLEIEGPMDLDEGAVLPKG